MTVDQTKLMQLRQALYEVNQNKHAFTPATFSLLALDLLERIRKLQTLPVQPTIMTNDEIRLVTVMFVDVVNSTQLVQTMDNSDWKQMINGAHQRIESVVTRYDGQVGQYLGDGILCFFGAQHSQSDDALRAISSALVILTALDTYALEMKKRFDIEFAVRIGVSTGRVVVGMIGGERKRELLALGPATNLASRLQNHAPIDGIAVDSNTYHQLRQQFIFEQQEPIQLKGFEDLVEYYHVIARQFSDSRQLTQTEMLSIKYQFVGRDRIINNLIDRWHRVYERGKFDSVLLTGELGIGKSRLLQEFTHALSNSRHAPIVLTASARYERRNTAYYFLRDLLLRLSRLNEETSLATVQKTILTQVTSLWAHPDAKVGAMIMGNMAGFGWTDAPEVKHLFYSGRMRATLAFNWVKRFLLALAEKHPLILIVDNIQWLDADSTKLLIYLIEELQGQTGMLLAASRPNYVEQQLLWQLEPIQWHTIEVPALSESSTEVLIKSVVQHIQNIPQNLMDLVIERADGNPFFVLEFLGMLFDNGVFQFDNETFTWNFSLVNYKLTESELPNSLLGVVQARIDDLDTSARTVLQAASVVGQTFWRSAIENLLDLESKIFLDKLIERDLIYVNRESSFSDEEQYAFRHPMYHEVAYEMIPRARREDMHHKTASWLMMHMNESNDYYGLLAQQLDASGQFESALVTYLEAVQDRIKHGLLNEAMHYIDKGLALGTKIPREVAIISISQLWMNRSIVLNDLSRFDEASAAANYALRLLDEMDSDDFQSVRIEASRILGLAYRSMGYYNEALVALSNAYSISEDEHISLTKLLRAFGSLSYRDC